jgi:maleylpyruvate isomerase
VAVTGVPNPAVSRPAIPSGDLVSAIRRAHERLGGAISPLTDGQVAEPSALPGWSRGHVLAHLVGLGAAAARQIDCARLGELVDLYDGGRPARDAAIEAGAPAPATEQVRLLRLATERMDDLLASLAPADWSRPVRFRHEDVRSMALAWWRETEVHLTDLAVGPRSDEWSVELCDHLVDFLAVRAPAGTRLVLAAPDGWCRELGDGADRTVRGERTDLVAWLAGREPVRAVEAADGAVLPTLAPWPDSTPAAEPAGGPDIPTGEKFCP